MERTEHIKQSARMGFTNQNASPASESGREEVHQQVPLQAPRKVYKDMGIACIALPELGIRRKSECIDNPTLIGGEDVRPQLPLPLSDEERRLHAMRGKYKRMGVDPGF